jgi:hypothetical protein
MSGELSRRHIHSDIAQIGSLFFHSHAENVASSISLAASKAGLSSTPLFLHFESTRDQISYRGVARLTEMIKV